MTRVTKPSTKMVTPNLAPLTFVPTAIPLSGFAAISRTDSLFSRFSRDNSGSTAMMFALIVAPVMMLTGMAVDYSRMVTVKARMQTALDAAALAGGRAAQTTSTNVATVAQNAATNYFNALPMPFVASKTLSSVTTNTAQTNFTWTATSWVKTPFLSVASILKPQGALAGAPAGCTASGWVCQKVVTQATTTIQAGGNNVGYSIETSIMLDITGSMQGQKLTDLKSAAGDAIDILIWADQSKYTSKVAITPFAQDVRLPTAAAFQVATGTAAANAAKTYNNNQGSNSFHKYATQYCVAERPGSFKYTDLAPSALNGYSMPVWLWDSWGSTCNVPARFATASAAPGPGGPGLTRDVAGFVLTLLGRPEFV